MPSGGKLLLQTCLPIALFRRNLWTEVSLEYQKGQNINQRHSNRHEQTKNQCIFQKQKSGEMLSLKCQLNPRIPHIEIHDKVDTIPKTCDNQDRYIVAGCR